jgi:hypothetical protein
VVRPEQGQVFLPGDIAAVSPDDVWIDGMYRAADGGGTDVLLHWNGSTWTQMTFGSASASPVGLSQDGRGGCWIATTGHGAYHYRDGSLTQLVTPQYQGQPFNLTDLYWIPGTASLLGLSSAQGTVVTYGR